MKYIVLDTNALYHWAGISKNNKVANDKFEELIRNNEISTTSTSIIEIITRYHKDLDTIKKILSPIKTGKIKEIISIGYTPLSTETIDKIITAKSISEIDEDITKIFQLKISIEAKFTRLFFLIIVCGIANNLIEEEETKNNDKKQLQQLNMHFQGALCEENTQNAFNLLLKALEDGYKTDQPQKIIKKQFNDLLECFFITFLINLHHVKNGVSIAEVDKLSNEVKNKIKTDLQTDPLFKKITKESTNNSMSIFNHKKYKERFKVYINDLIKEVIDLQCWSGCGLDYFIRKMGKYFLEQAIFKKNDILDMLIIFALHNSKTCLLTFDNDLINFLSDNHPESYNLINSILL